MSNISYGPPEKFKAIRDFIPCVSTYGLVHCSFKYSTEDLLNQALAGLLLMGVPTNMVYQAGHGHIVFINTKDIEDETQTP